LFDSVDDIEKEASVEAICEICTVTQTAPIVFPQITKLIKDIETKKHLKLQLIRILRYMNYDLDSVKKV
jgi:hypothetical protein